jgi:hypothetical protein
MHCSDFLPCPGDHTGRPHNAPVESQGSFALVAERAQVHMPPSVVDDTLQWNAAWFVTPIE